MKVEETLLTVKTSRWIALGFLGKKFMLIYLLIMVAALIAPLFVPDMPELVYLGYGLVGLYVLLFLGRLLGFKREKADVTNHRLILYRRIGTSERRIMIPLHQIVQVELERGKLGRLLGFGSVKLHNAGGGKADLESIGKVENFNEVLHIQMMQSWSRNL
ncbi:PH domain-containing protein [Liberiplasma polymorphum]|uniref:PH domain-containing protein n=1 Tax=Liberiplasma polymorphum TaxID=3374570 RepID=UPI003775AACF